MNADTPSSIMPKQAGALRRAVESLSATTTLTLAILALASGVYTYLGVRGLLQGTGTTVFFGAIVYSTAVSVGIYAFWSYLIQLTPHMRSNGGRAVLFAAMLLGSAMIVAMSSWLNAAALAGGAALEQHLAETTEEYQARLNSAHDNALAAQSLLPDIQLASERFKALATEEEASGALTGTSGSGTVVQLLVQTATQLDGLAEEVRGARTASDSFYATGGAHLSEMRRIVSGTGAIEARGIAYGDEAVALAGVITALQQSSIAPAVKRAADDLALTFVAPEADSQSADLASRQTTIVARVEDALKAQSAALSGAAQAILDRDAVAPLKFTPLSTAEAILLYAGDFVPSWAGAISIDLLPAVLILILSAVHAAIRFEERNLTHEDTMSVAELNRALAMAAAMNTETAPNQYADAEDEDIGVRAPKSIPPAPSPVPLHPNGAKR